MQIAGTFAAAVARLLRHRRAVGLGAALAWGLGGALGASAQQQSLTVKVSEDDGFLGVCAAPCYEIEKHVDVWAPGTGPNVCPATEYTYVYTLTNLTNPPSDATLPSPGIPLDRFTVTVDSSLVSNAHFIPGAGIAPVSTTINPATVVWEFPTSTACPACLNQGQTSDPLYICSPAAPGRSPDVVTTTAIVLDARGECIVPTQPPVVGAPTPCTIGFWKNRVNGKRGLLKFFPDPDLATVVNAALGLSTVFTSADLEQTGCPDFDDLICALTSKGNRTTAERGRQQLAATLLNLAAGDAFPDNGKCALFEENNITTNACGSNLTVGTAVGSAKAGVTSGESQAEHEALECLDDINNEIGVVQ